MDLVIKDLNKEQSDTIAAFAHAVKKRSVEGIELEFEKDFWVSKEKDHSFFLRI